MNRQHHDLIQRLWTCQLTELYRKGINQLSKLSEGDELSDSQISYIENLEFIYRDELRQMDEQQVRILAGEIQEHETSLHHYEDMLMKAEPSGFRNIEAIIVSDKKVIEQKRAELQKVEARLSAWADK